jgi:hypothetical protein
METDSTKEFIENKYSVSESVYNHQNCFTDKYEEK